MKKIAALVLTFVMLISFPVFAAAAEKTEISFDKKSSDDGKIIVDVILSEDGDPCMLQFCVEYDSAVLDCVSAVSGEVFSGISAPIINKTEGKIYLIWDALKPLENGGTVLRLEFSQKSGGKTTAVKIAESEEFIIANSDFEEIGSIKAPLEIVTSGSSVEAENLPKAKIRRMKHLQPIPKIQLQKKNLPNRILPKNRRIHRQKAAILPPWRKMRKMNLPKAKTLPNLPKGKTEKRKTFLWSNLPGQKGKRKIFPGFGSLSAQPQL